MKINNINMFCFITWGWCPGRGGILTVKPLPCGPYKGLPTLPGGVADPPGAAYKGLPGGVEAPPDGAYTCLPPAPGGVADPPGEAVYTGLVPVPGGAA